MRTKSNAPQGAKPTRLEKHRDNEACKGRKRRELSATDEEWQALKDYLNQLRSKSV